jgi:hypothetical protein
MKPAWVFPETGPYQVQGRDLSEDNFAPENRTNLDILIREILQNPLDARAIDNPGPVRVLIKILQPGYFDADYLAMLLNGDYINRLEASGGNPLADFSEASVLVIEDFGTTGLQGVYDNQNTDGKDENWNAFWFREGEGAKAFTGSNGRAGQGKITFYRIGAARAVFGFTVRKSDKKRLLMGRSAFRRVYPFNGSKYLRHSFWCTDNGQPLPIISDDEIMAFRKAFGFSRLSEPGLSLLIPFPVNFDTKDAIKTIIKEFYYPIACRNLEVSIGGDTVLNSLNVDEIADHLLPDDEIRKIPSCFTKGFRKLVRDVITDEENSFAPMQMKEGWDKTTSLKDDVLSPDELEQLRTAMEKGERVSVRCPITVRPKDGAAVKSWFDVHLEVPENLASMEEAYLRSDLLIGAENHLANSTHLQKTRGLTIIKEGWLSDFLADAEEPTHLKWNGSRPRLSEEYINPQATLRAVRNAAPRLLTLISRGLIKQDIKALAKYFNRPSEDGNKHASGGVKKGGAKTNEPLIKPIPVHKPFRIHAGKDIVSVLPNKSVALKIEDLPMSCILELAYEGLDQDPFKMYDPFDFDLADERAHLIKVTGAIVTERKSNRIRFDVNDPEFILTVQGFDPNIRLRARLHYTEDKNGTSISEE